MSAEEKVRALLSSGDRKGAATEAIRGFGPQVLQYLRAVLRDEAEAREAFSQWAENLWKGLPSFRGESSFKTWSLRLACNAALNLRDEAWRKRGRRLATGEASGGGGPIVAELHPLPSVPGAKSSPDPQMQMDRRYRLLREGSWKLVTSSKGDALLYDLASDPQELRNLALEPGYRGAADALVKEAEERWDFRRIRAEVIASQRQRRAIHAALTTGRIAPWDYAPRTDAAASYYRNYDSARPDPDRALS